MKRHISIKCLEDKITKLEWTCDIRGEMIDALIARIARLENIERTLTKGDKNNG